MKKTVKAVRAKPGETWLVSIDDKLDLKKIVVEATYKEAVAIRTAPEVPEPEDFFEASEEVKASMTPIVATRYLRWSDIDFVEKL